MFIRIFVCLLGFIFGANLILADEEYYTLVSSDGREIKAKILDISVKMVEIQREDGSRFDVWKNQLSDRSQQLIDRLEHKRLFDNPENFELGLSTRRKSINRQTFSFYKTVNERMQYRFRINKPESLSMDGLEIEYKIFVQRSLNDLTHTISGKETLNGGTGDEEIEIFSKIFSLYSRELLPNWTWTYSKSKYEDEVLGAWIRLYQGDKLVAEKAAPRRLMRLERWPSRDQAMPIPAARAVD
ncbi:MAG: hypothetical protein HRU10_13220 [Opitutales bacterium]|nr:hypothetical protein [Opitutales bacterium]